jgi:anionic cell wall polymer biosynthesis LytR-Cps2A-Psr (LCP) family protein
MPGDKIQMNSTRTLAIVAVLTAATLVVGLTVVATITPSALAGGGKKDGHDKYVKRGQNDYKKDGHDKYVKETQAYGKDKGSGNGNTNTIQILKQNAKASGKNSTVEQNGENSICTHPSETCTSQSNQPLEVS